MTSLKTRLENQACCNCKFYREIVQEHGLCRRYAPKPIATTDCSDIFWKQPDVFPEDWCGEWRSKNETA